MAQSWFSDVKLAPAIEVFALTAQFKEDTFPNKVNLGVGAYRTDDSVPWVLPVVRKVESAMAADPTLNHEYLPIPGNPDYRAAGIKLLLGEDSPAIKENRVDAVQAIGGTGALRIAYDFCKSRLGAQSVYISTPTWGNHKGIGTNLGYKVVEYRYWNKKEKKLDIEGFVQDLQNAPSGSMVVLHSCAHNPTGVDPTKEQWKRLAEVVKEKRLFPLFDCAYQGFATGDLDEDAWAVRYFISQGFELLAAQSFSKNFGLYNERCGNLIFVSNNSESVSKIRSQMDIIMRQTWSNSPAHGSRVVASVLNNPSLREEWVENLKTMAGRILAMRKALYEKLLQIGAPGSWDHIVQQKGMFSYTGLNESQSEFLIKHKHIYLLKSGRINMCAITTKNVDYVANAIKEALTTAPSL